MIVLFTSYVIDMICCKICHSSHSRQVCCNICDGKYHLKCFTLIADDQHMILDNISAWMCQYCQQCVFPFKWLDDDDFMDAIRNNSSEYLELFENIEDVLQIIECDEANTRLPIDDLDPDQNFYNDYRPDINCNCKYFNEDSFDTNFTKTNAKNIENPVSFWHINIRSVPKNVSSFEYFLINLKWAH